jgi:hypothetical protein
LLNSHDVTPARTIRHISTVAYGDLHDYATWTRDGRMTLSPPDQLEPGMTAAIREIRQTPTGEIDFKLHDKGACLALLAKIQGLVRDRVEVTGADGGPIETVVLTPAERARRVHAIIRAGGPGGLAERLLPTGAIPPSTTGDPARP